MSSVVFFRRRGSVAVPPAFLKPSTPMQPSLVFFFILCFFVLFLKKQNWRGPASRRHGSYKFTCWFSGRFSEAFGGLSCVRLLSGEKTPLCKNICCGNGCQTPFCGLRFFFAQRVSFVLIIYVGESVMIKRNLVNVPKQSTVGLFIYFL